eukprot:1152796-Pelagomonas_calceolata.AAC.1
MKSTQSAFKCPPAYNVPSVTGGFQTVPFTFFQGARKGKKNSVGKEILLTLIKENRHVGSEEPQVPYTTKLQNRKC